MPGVLIVEALAQVGAVAILSQEENKGKVAYFGAINNAKFKKKVVPGDKLRLECQIIKRKGPVGIGSAVATVDGKVAQRIPEGTQSGTKFRLRGQGIQYLNGRGRGDQYVIVEVEIPKKLNRTQREALKAFEDSLKDENYEKRKGFFKNLRDRFSS